MQTSAEDRYAVGRGGLGRFREFPFKGDPAPSESATRAGERDLEPSFVRTDHDGSAGPISDQ
ncbi:MAG TPA: hypothetical protein DCE44_02565 [Verrucomicrobiales bacterium]|nr:hypothetical protein [Verrucomicrobiales bacterium]